jgi:hypothetical protein
LVLRRVVDNCDARCIFKSLPHGIDVHWPNVREGGGEGRESF